MANNWHRGDWMQTFTGQQFYPMSPSAEDVDPIDIAHALGLLCRYNGHIDRFYSVAEHCVLMSQAVPEEDALWALLHDATEAYVGDMIRPLKLHMPDYRAAEDRVMDAIVTRFGLRSNEMPASVKDADSRILLTERAALMPGKQSRLKWDVDSLVPLPVTISAWGPEEASAQYTARLAELFTEASA